MTCVELERALLLDVLWQYTRHRAIAALCISVDRPMPHPDDMFPEHTLTDNGDGRWLHTFRWRPFMERRQ